METVESENLIELGLNFDLTQFSENFKCDCESGSCSICTEINSVTQPELRVLTDAPNFELDCCAELKEAKNAKNTKAIIWEEESAERFGKISSLVPHTQQMPVEGEMLL
ncbi:hypothetical protein LR48_Vigan03g099400 [Vigna angularis]|uniref:Uncharacterized protein n=1 Tax=Phaseolus angularis TaxID=3914 RepID=A0A0L9U4L8_PHAAN|nr:hypothetical protein LR48_Vigan03g099400 [Vigna angularis]